MKEYTITIKRKITDNDLICILCGATGNACSWCSDIRYDDNSYKKARNDLITAGKKEKFICYEDVLLQMLKNKKIIIFCDEEVGEEYELSLGMILSGIERYMSSEYCSSIDIDEWDDVDFDNVIQYALFNEIVYG